MSTFFPGRSTPGPLPRLDADTVRAAASGRWPAILADLSIQPALLSKRGNQPCPACGGRDRFQFIDKGAGRFVCRAHENQGGDGFALVEHWLGCGFREALAAVADVLGLSGDTGQTYTQPPRREAAAPAPRASTDNTAKLTAWWDAAGPVTAANAAGRYLTRRGLARVVNDCPEALRYIEALPYWHQDEKGRPVELGCFPALLARLVDPAGALAGLHRLYLSASGEKLRLSGNGGDLPCKKLMTAREGASHGAAVRLYPPEAGRLALAEGIETALAVRLGSGLPVWACVSAGGLVRVSLPPEVVDVWIFADHDASGTGQQAADRLARRLWSEDRRVRVLLPEQPGTDWLDVLNEQERSAA